MRVLYVCTANICRSASAAQLLRDAVGTSPELADIEVRSAGTAALPGSPGCSVAPALAGHAADHRSQRVTRELVEWADLILPAARDHRPAIVELAPAARSRVFTMRQAGRSADWLMDSGMVAAARERAGAAGPADADWPAAFPEGDPRADVLALPVEPGERVAWLLGEMDAARGMAAAPREALDEGVPQPEQRGRFGRRRDTTDTNSAHPDDVPDPHVLGMDLHQRAFEQITASTDSLVRLLVELAT